MTTRWSCSECGAKVVETAIICILEEATGEYRDFCFRCGMEALKRRMQELGKEGVVGGWHFTIPDLTGKRHTNINYLPEVVD